MKGIYCFSTILVSACIIDLLTGCSSMSELTGGRRYPANLPDRPAMVRDQLQDDTNAVKACYRKLADDPLLSPIKDEVYLGDVDEQPFNYLTVTTKPTANDKPVILDWAKKRETCDKLARDTLNKWSNQFPPSLVALLSSTISTGQSLVADLYNGSYTYAEFAKKRQELNMNTHSSMAQIKTAVQQHNYEEAVRIQELALQYQQNQILQRHVDQQYWNSIRGHSLHCTTDGDTTNCQGD